MYRFLMGLWIIPLSLLMLVGASAMVYGFVTGLPGSFTSIFHTDPQPESTCDTLLRTMKPSDDGYEAMMEECSNP